MNSNEERMMGLKVLKDAVKSVDAAMDAIEAFAATLGVKRERNVSIAELADMVAGEEGMKPACAFAVLICAFDLIRDLNLTVVVVEESEEDDE